MNKKKKIYLAGGFCDWRDKVTSIIKNVSWKDPRIAQNPLTGQNLPNWFEMEAEMIKNSDAMIVFVAESNPSGFGTTFEMGMAYALGIPYILINEKNNSYQWSMQTRGSFMSFKTLEQAFDWMKKTKWMGLEVSDYEHNPSGKPCTHECCWAHTTHKCELCGRVGCAGEAFVKKENKILT